LIVQVQAGEGSNAEYAEEEGEDADETLIRVLSFLFSAFDHRTPGMHSRSRDSGSVGTPALFTISGAWSVSG